MMCNIAFPTIEVWARGQVANLEPGDEIKCHECKGKGEIECDCDCPHCEHYDFCDACDGEGTFTIGDDMTVQEHENYVTFFSGNKREYAKEMVTYAAMWSEYTAADKSAVEAKLLEFVDNNPPSPYRSDMYLKVIGEIEAQKKERERLSKLFAHRDLPNKVREK